MTKKLPEVGPLEMQVLGLLGSSDELSVTDIQKQLKNKGHDLAYTTVMTVLVRLFAKNLVSRKKDGRLFIYSVANRQDNSPVRILERVKSSLFGHDKLKPILGLIDADDDLSRAELEELRKAVDAKLKKVKK